jgi:hypothetical protein
MRGFQYSNVARRLPIWHTSPQSLSEAELCLFGRSIEHEYERDHEYDHDNQHR